jgi:hypothetical protein
VGFEEVEAFDREREKSDSHKHQVAERGIEGFVWWPMQGTGHREEKENIEPNSGEQRKRVKVGRGVPFPLVDQAGVETVPRLQWDVRTDYGLDEKEGDTQGTDLAHQNPIGFRSDVRFLFDRSPELSFSSNFSCVQVRLRHQRILVP